MECGVTEHNEPRGNSPPWRVVRRRALGMVSAGPEERQHAVTRAELPHENAIGKARRLGSPFQDTVLRVGSRRSIPNLFRPPKVLNVRQREVGGSAASVGPQAGPSAVTRTSNTQ